MPMKLLGYLESHVIEVQSPQYYLHMKKYKKALLILNAGENRFEIINLRNSNLCYKKPQIFIPYNMPFGWSTHFNDVLGDFWELSRLASFINS